MRKFLKFPPEVTGLVASRYATSWQFATIFAVIFVLLDGLGAMAGEVMSVYDFPLLSIFSALCIWLFLVLSGLIIWRKAEPDLVALKNVLTWLIASATSIFVGRFLVWLFTGEDIPPFGLDQLITWIIGGFVNIAGYAIVISGVFRYREISESLRRESNRLDSLRQILASHLEALKASYLAEVRHRIAPMLDDIRAALAAANPGEVMSQARAAIETAVLPLSQQIASEQIEALLGEVPKLQNHSLASRLKHLRTSRLEVAQNLSPLLSAFVFIASILPAFGVFYSTPGLLAGAMSLAIILLGQLLFASVLAKRRMTFLPALAATFLASATIAYLAGQCIQIFVTENESDADAFLALGVFLVVFLLSFAQLINSLSLKFLEQTAVTQQQYSQDLQKRDSAIRSLQSRVAKVIHADIQAKLRAILLRVKSGGITQDNLGQLNQDLEYINSVLATIGDEQKVDFAVELQGLVEFWSGVCEINLDLESGVFEALAARSDLIEAALDVLSEAVSNAVKHAEAKTATIALSLTSQSLEISVLNPASEIKIEAISTGQGSRLLDRVATSWRVESAENSTTLLVSIAL